MKIGQLVLTRVQSIPSDKIRKLHEKWSGPAIIIDMIGQDSNPRAVQVLDLQQRTKKVISMQDVKPYVPRRGDKEIDLINLNEETEPKIRNNDDLMKPGYFVETNPIETVGCCSD